MVCFNRMRHTERDSICLLCKLFEKENIFQCFQDSNDTITTFARSLAPVQPGSNTFGEKNSLFVKVTPKEM